MAVDQSISSPDEGELVVCTVTEVKQNGAYVALDEYAGINGFIFIGEVASGWIKKYPWVCQRWSTPYLQSTQNPKRWRKPGIITQKRE